MTVDISKLKTGDVVHVRATVKSTLVRPDGNRVSLSVESRFAPNGFWANPEEIIAIEPRSLAVGDKLRDHLGYEHEVVAFAPDGQAITQYQDVDKYWWAVATHEHERETWERLP